jgi:5-formyltetrahydrofolate cyclo-ligase
MSLEAQKTEARRAAFAWRKRAHAAQSGTNAGVLSEVLAGYRGAPVAGFMPIGTEIDPSPALAEACAHGPVGLPVIEAAGLPLRFALYVPGMQMIEGAFKALIPEKITWMVPEIVIVPLVAWDAQGGRLGYGGGYYDRTLEGLRARGPVLAIGFAFNVQKAEALPLEPTDQPLDMIVTEDRIVQFLR